MRNPWYLIWSALMALATMTACRYLFFYYNNHELVSAPPSAAILTGLRFDILVICWWLLPLLAAGLIVHFRPSAGAVKLFKAENIYLRLGLVLFILTGLADIFYYHQFASHLNAAAFNWFRNPGDVLGMIWGDKTLRYAMIGLLIILILMLFVHLKISKKTDSNKFPIQPKIAFLILVLIGIRGGLGEKSLQAKDTRISEHYFFNQVAENPVYSLYRSLFNPQEAFYQYDILTESRANELSAYYLNPEKEHRRVSPIKNNVVIILMESMASHKLKHAPFLQKLIHSSLYFDSFYSTGEHTYNGIFSSLFGEPARMEKHMLRYMENAQLGGLPKMCKDAGYFNIFHIPHSRYFDNMGAFLWKHHFDSLVDFRNLPADLKGGSNWGTCDHKFLEYAIRNMDALAKKNRPFFNVILTISDHPPYYLPESGLSFHDTETLPERMVKYADYSLQQFFENAAKKTWYKNTVFVLLGDHGQLSGTDAYPLPLSMHHIPLLIFNPSGQIKSGVIHTPGAQQDLYPTLASILNMPFSENPLSVDLTQSRRDFTFFCSDNYVGYLNHYGYGVIDREGGHQFWDMQGVVQTGSSAKSAFSRLFILNRYAAWRLDKYNK